MEKSRSKEQEDELKQLSREVVDLLKKVNADDSDGKARKRKRDKKAQAKSEAAGAMARQDDSPSGSELQKAKTDKQGNPYFELTDKRRVTLSKFRGKARVDIREFYAGADGDLLPGKKGISLSHEEYLLLKQLVTSIDAGLAKLK